MANFLIFLVLVSPVLWLISVSMLTEWKHFWKFFIANSLILALYLTFIMDPVFVDFGHDEYGLKRLTTSIAAIVTHIVLGLVFAVGHRLKVKKS
jgi:hypothetical protein